MLCACVGWGGGRALRCREGMAAAVGGAGLSADGLLSLEVIASAVVAIDALAFRSRDIGVQLGDTLLSRELHQVVYFASLSI